MNPDPPNLPPSADPAAIVLLSGGLDSATCLAIAQAHGFTCHCLSFDYHQRHARELAAAARIAAHRSAASHRVATIDLRAFGGSALTDEHIPVPKSDEPFRATDSEIPVTYVPARNTIFLAYALALAEVLDARAIYIGVNAVDYSGYPDCRPAFIQAFEHMARLATKAGVEGAQLRIHAPLIELTKADIIRRGVALGVDYGITITCYQADDEGRACGGCEACRLRAAGFAAAGIADPTPYRARTA